MHKLALGVAYDGTRLAGLQWQRDLPTVQGLLETALGRIAAEPVRISAAGRTDAGVHATGQVVSFSTQAARPLRAWTAGVNSHLPDTVRIRWAQTVPPEFDARFSAAWRRYVYVFHDAEEPVVHLRDLVWSTGHLDADRMHRAALKLLGERDFSAFRGAQCQSPSPMRNVQHIQVVRRGPFVALSIQANAFLLHMVRNMASVLHDVGRRTREPDELTELLAGRDRTRLGRTAPAGGLYLVDVGYPLASFPKGVVPGVLAAAGGLDHL